MPPKQLTMVPGHSVGVNKLPLWHNFRQQHNSQSQSLETYGL